MCVGPTGKYGLGFWGPFSFGEFFCKNSLSPSVFFASLVSLLNRTFFLIIKSITVLVRERSMTVKSESRVSQGKR